MKKIEKNLIRKTMENDNIKGKVEIKKGLSRGFVIYYNNWYIGCALSMTEIYTMLNVINNMIVAVATK